MLRSKNTKDRNVSNKPRSGRLMTISTPKIVDCVRKRIERNPIRSMYTIAKELGVSKDTVRKIASKKLIRHSYKVLTDQTLFKKNRLEKC